MGLLEIYCDGAIDVDSDEYIESVYDEEHDDVVEVPIEGLDEIVVPIRTAELTLEYPFERPCKMQITGDPGITSARRSEQIGL